MIVDANVHLSRWPCRRLPGDETPELVARLRKRNVTQAWAASFDGILHRDIAAVNARLVSDCRAHGAGLLVPFGSINPKLPSWQEDVRRCAVDHRMPGIRLYPNYHGYELTDAAFAELLHIAAEREILVQLAVSMEDTRTQHPLLRVQAVDLSALPALVRNEPKLRLVLLNCTPSLRGRQLKLLAEAGEVYFDIATVEGVEGLARLADQVTPDRILFGSYFPFFYFESAFLKVEESGLPESAKSKILEGNAGRLVGRTR
jgi:predicted TIM-barrel fold metal-dependent hydrolase